MTGERKKTTSELFSYCGSSSSDWLRPCNGYVGAGPGPHDGKRNTTTALCTALAGSRGDSTGLARTGVGENYRPGGVGACLAVLCKGSSIGLGLGVVVKHARLGAVLEQLDRWGAGRGRIEDDVYAGPSWSGARVGYSDEQTPQNETMTMVRFETAMKLTMDRLEAQRQPKKKF